MLDYKLLGLLETAGISFPSIIIDSVKSPTLS